MIFWKKGGALAAALSLLAVLYAMTALEGASRERLARLRDDIDALKTAALDAAVLGMLPQSEEAILAKVETLRAGPSFRAILRAYSIGTQTPGDALPVARRGNAVDEVRNLEGFLVRVTREQRKSSNVLIGLLFALTLIFVAMFFWSDAAAGRSLARLEARREFDGRLVAAIERERDLIAFDLHDSLLQKLGFIEQRIAGTHATCPQSREIRTLVGDSIRELRSLYRGLRDEGGDVGDPGARLAEIFADYRSLGPAVLDASAFGLEASNLAPASWHHVVRIVQELLSNGYKHAGASHITLRVFGLPGVLRIHYADDGVGLPAEGPSILGSIDYRCGILGASIHRSAGSDASGTAVKIEVPLA